MITSAVEQEGKSTTIANLAVALARGGQTVALVDLDLRRPFMDKFFDLGDRPGVTQVALGRASLEEALVEVPIAAMKPSPSSSTPYDLSARTGTATGMGTGTEMGTASADGSSSSAPDRFRLIRVSSSARRRSPPCCSSSKRSPR